MTLLRRLNDAGLQRFSEFLDSLRTDVPQEIPFGLLTQADTSEDVGVKIEIAPRSFTSRFDAAKYLHEALSGTGLRNVELDRGLWAWLTLFYFDDLCPRDSSGHRSPNERARWIPEPKDYRRYYRHLLAGPYVIYRAHHDNPGRAMSLLHGHPRKIDDIAAQLAAYQRYVTNKAIVEMSTRLYLDSATSKPKRGAGGKGPGTPRRLVVVLKQFEVTWDLYAMSTEGLLALLPMEFQRFRE